MASFIKGIVMKRRYNLVQIELKNGRRFWHLPDGELGLREFVWVAWDYTHEKPRQVLTLDEFEKVKVENSLEEPGAFSDPDDEGKDGADDLIIEAYSPQETGFADVLSYDDEEPRVRSSELGAFSDPWGDGDSPHHNN